MDKIELGKQYKEIVRVKIELNDGNIVENIWNKEGIYKEYQDKAVKVIVEAIGHNCIILTLNEYRAVDVADVQTIVLQHQAYKQPVYVGKCIILKSGDKHYFYIDGNKKIVKPEVTDD